MKKITKELFHYEVQSIIKEARIELGLNQAEMGRALKLSQGTISKIEKRKSHLDLFSWFIFEKFIASKKISEDLIYKIDKIRC